MTDKASNSMACFDCGGGGGAKVAMHSESFDFDTIAPIKSLKERFAMALKDCNK